MATLWISEYSATGIDNGGNQEQVVKEPALVNQTPVTYTTSTASAAFNAATKIIAVRASAIAHLAFGTAPTATANYKPISAGETHYFAVDPGDKVAAYDGTSV